MTLSEPTLAPPMAPSTVDMAQIFTAHAQQLEGGLVGPQQVAVGADGQQGLAQAAHVIGAGMEAQQALVGKLGFKETFFDDS